jgi:hypothetical protein
MSNNVNIEEKVYATGFKGFDPGMKCRDKQYAENTVFEEKGGDICGEGVIHFCENPLDVLNYYPVVNSNGEFNEFAEVKALARTQSVEGKSATTKLKIGLKLDLKGFIDAVVQFSFKKLYKQFSSAALSRLASSEPDSQLVSSGDCSYSASSGYNSKLVSSGAGSQLASSGSWSQLVSSGDRSWLATSGNHNQLVSSGDRSQLASSGNHNQLVSSGDRSRLASSGDYNDISATGIHSVIASTGIRGRVRGALGCFIACAEWQDIEGVPTPVSFPSAQVDGVNIKADTWYTVRDGKFVEVQDNE